MGLKNTNGESWMNIVIVIKSVTLHYLFVYLDYYLSGYLLFNINYYILFCNRVRYRIIEIDYIS